MCNMANGFRIRAIRPGDGPAVCQVCLLTGATGLYDDAALLGHRYVGPYLALAPDLTWVLEDASGICGYGLGARDTPAFYARLVRKWLPPLRTKHPAPSGNSANRTPADRLRAQF